MNKLRKKEMTQVKLGKFNNTIVSEKFMTSKQLLYLRELIIEQLYSGTTRLTKKEDIYSTALLESNNNKLQGEIMQRSRRDNDNGVGVGDIDDVADNGISSRSSSSSSSSSGYRPSWMRSSRRSKSSKKSKSKSRISSDSNSSSDNNEGVGDLDDDFADNDISSSSSRNRRRSRKIKSKNRSSSSSKSRRRSSMTLEQKIKEENKKNADILDQKLEDAKIPKELMAKNYKDAMETYDEVMTLTAQNAIDKFLAKGQEYLQPEVGVFDTAKRNNAQDPELLKKQKNMIFNTAGFLIMMLISIVSGGLYYGPLGEQTIPEHPDPHFHTSNATNSTLGIMEDPVNTSGGYKTTLDYYCTPFFGIILSVIFLWQRGYLNKLLGSGSSTNSSTDIYSKVMMGSLDFSMGVLNLIPRLILLSQCYSEQQEYRDDPYNAEIRFQNSTDIYNKDLNAFNKCKEKNSLLGWGKSLVCTKPKIPIHPNDFGMCMMENDYTLFPVSDEKPTLGWSDLLSWNALSVLWQQAKSGGAWGINLVVDIILNIVDSMGETRAFPIILFIISTIGAKMAYDAYVSHREIQAIKNIQRIKLFRDSLPFRFNTNKLIEIVMPKPGTGGVSGEIIASKKRVNDLLHQLFTQQQDVTKLAIEKMKASSLASTAYSQIHMANTAAEQLKQLHQQQQQQLLTTEQQQQQEADEVYRNLAEPILLPPEKPYSASLHETLEWVDREMEGADPNLKNLMERFKRVIIDDIKTKEEKEKKKEEEEKEKKKELVFA